MRGIPALDAAVVAASLRTGLLGCGLDANAVVLGASFGQMLTNS